MPELTWSEKPKSTGKNVGKNWGLQEKSEHQWKIITRFVWLSANGIERKTPFATNLININKPSIDG